jgi:hypothetical protein
VDLAGDLGRGEPGQVVAVVLGVVLDRVAAGGDRLELPGALRPVEVLADGEERDRQGAGGGVLPDAGQGDVVAGVGSPRRGGEPVDGVVVVDLVEIDRDGAELVGRGRQCSALSGGLGVSPIVDQP